MHMSLIIEKKIQTLFLLGSGVSTSAAIYALDDHVGDRNRERSKTRNNPRNHQLNGHHQLALALTHHGVRKEKQSYGLRMLLLS